MKKFTLKYIIFTLLLALIVANNSCSDFLDTKASNEIPDKIETVQEAQAMLNSVYADMLRDEYYGCQILTYGDVRGNDMGTTASGRRSNTQYLFNHLNNLTSANAGEFWDVIYKTLHRTNSLLSQINSNSVKPKGNDEQLELNDIKGQALTLRALLHFDLVRVYGEPYLKNKTAPGLIIANRVIPAGEQNQRATVEATYNFIVEDLKTALGKTTSATTPLLSQKVNPGYINYWASEALLSKVYLYMGKWQDSYDLAIDVINSGKYTLVSNARYVESWGEEYTTEALFDIHSSETANADRESIGYVYSPSGYAAVSMTKVGLDLLKEDPNDVRLQLVQTKVADNGITQHYLAKYPGRKGNLYVNNAHILRFSEVYLIAAEAGLKAGKTLEASTYLNVIRKRANPSVADVTATAELVANERRKELAGEGNRYFDIIRDLGTATVQRLGTPSFPLSKVEYVQEISWNNKYTHLLILPIPKVETDVNPNIQQNDKYINN